MKILDQFLELTPSDRRLRLGQKDILDAIVALGPNNGVAWIEQHIESPILPGWGKLFYSLKPDWTHYVRWISVSKLHCLAAVDAILLCTPNPCFDDDKVPETPSGADAGSINAAISYALDIYDNPRLQEAAKIIRRSWPVDKKARRNIRLPKPIKKLASELFGSDGNSLKIWTKSLAAEVDVPETSDDFWELLLEFAEKNNFVAIVDWRECPEGIVEKVRRLNSAKGLTVSWQPFAEFRGKSEDLFRKIENQIKGSAVSLVSLDTGADSYALTFLSSDAIRSLEFLIVDVFDDSRSIQRF